MLNPENPVDRKNLLDAIKRSHNDMEHWRKMRLRYLKAYQPTTLQVGGAEQEIITPLLYQAVETDVADHVANNPRVVVETDFSHLKSHARRRGLMINKRLVEIDFNRSLQAAFYDAEFMLGILEVHNAESYPLDFGDYGTVDPGLPSVAHVPFDDYFYDSSARRYQDRRFDGKFFRADYELLEGDPNIERSVKKQLPKVFTAEIAKAEAATRANVDAQGEGATADLLSPAVDCITVFLCHESLIVTLVADHPDLPPLRIQKWKDREGPFKLLQLGFMPDQVVGVSPVSVLFVLQNLVNLVWLKRREQAATQKNVTAYQGAAKKDAQRLKDARNNEFIHMAQLDKVKMFSTMGPDANLGQYGMEALAMLDRAGGNLAMRSGTGATTDTVGQDQMIHGAISQITAKKANSVLGYTANVVHSLGKLLDADRFYERELFYEAPNKMLRLPYPWKPGLREGEASQFHEKITPYSMMYVNPSAQFKGLNDVINTIVPLLPYGQTFDLAEYVEMAAEYLNLPRLRDIVKPGAFPASDPNNFASELGALDVKNIPKVGKPNGEYTRRGVPSGSQYGSQQLQAAMVRGGGAGQPTGVKDL